MPTLRPPDVNWSKSDIGPQAIQGPPRTIDDERVAGQIKTTLHANPANGSTH